VGRSEILAVIGKVDEGGRTDEGGA